MNRPSGLHRRLDNALSLLVFGCIAAGILTGVALMHIAGWGCEP